MTNDNIAEPNIIEQLQKMARLTGGHILIQQLRTRLYLDGKNVLHQTIGDSAVAGSPDASRKVIDTMAAIVVLLENQSSYSADETYCAVVTHWRQRSADIAEFVCNELQVPVVPMLITPDTLNAAFKGDPVLPFDDGHRASAALYGLFDKST